MPDTEAKGAATAASRYKKLATGREPFLRRAREASALTLPSLIPPEGVDGQNLNDPFQSVGARGINNLAAKLLLALFPPGSTNSFFRLTVDPLALEELVAEVVEASGGSIDGDTARAEIESSLSQIERAVIGRMEEKGVRTTLFETLKHLLVGGNVCLQVLKGGGARLHALQHYVCQRDTSGNVLDLIVKERISREALPQNIVEALPLHSETEPSPEGGDKDGEYDLYTWVQRDGKVWRIHQEIGDRKIDGSEGTDPIDKPRFLALRMTKVDGEDYGRGTAGEYLGDLRSLEGLSQAIVEGSAAAAKILIFVDESGLTSREDVARAPNMAVLDGSAADISSFQLDKFADFRVAYDVMQNIESRLEQAFLLFSSVQRNAERVTAEEIRTVAHELEQALGGVYSILAQELQRPLVDRVMLQLQRENALPALPKDTVRPQIVAGLEGLSRSSDLTKYQALLGLLQGTFGPEQIAEYVDLGVYATLAAAALGIDQKGLIRTEEQVQAARQAAQQAAIAQKAAPVAVKGAVDIARDQQTTNQG